MSIQNPEADTQLLLLKGEKFRKIHLEQSEDLLKRLGHRPVDAAVIPTVVREPNGETKVHDQGILEVRPPMEPGKIRRFSAKLGGISVSVTTHSIAHSY